MYTTEDFSSATVYDVETTEILQYNYFNIFRGFLSKNAVLK